MDKLDKRVQGPEQIEVYGDKVPSANSNIIKITIQCLSMEQSLTTHW